jgi:peptide chain release factor 1
LFSAYSKFAINNSLEVELYNSENGHIVACIKGNNAGKYFQYETGKHVVQRRPKNGKGKAHTSVVSVAVLPLPPDRSYKPLPDHEVDIIAQCGHGPGGQHQNKSHTSIRAIHKPTALSVFIVGRSQIANKKEAIKILTAKVNEQFTSEKVNNYNYIRKHTLGDGNRGDKIRTYNFMESRITDSRSGVKLRNMDLIFSKGKFELLNK